MAKKTNCVINGIPYYRKYANIYGKRKMVYADSVKSWEKKVDELKYLERQGLIESSSTMLKAMDFWIYETLPNRKSIRNSTYSIYEGIYRNSIKDEHFMGLAITEVTYLVLELFFNKVYEKKKSNHAVDAVRKVLRLFFEELRKAKVVLTNPIDDVPRLPSAPKKEIVVFSDEDIPKLLKALEQKPKFKLAYLLSLTTGMRIAEILGLQHKDLEGKEIVEVNKQLLRRRIVTKGSRAYQWEMGPPKTNAGYRTIPLPKEVQKEYKAHLLRLKEECLRRGLPKPKPSNLVFISKDGGPVQQAQVSSDLKHLLMAAGVKHKTFHTFRHTYITKLVQAGVDLPTIMKLAGHEKYETTLKYTHIEEEHAHETADIMNNLCDKFVIK